MRNYINEPTKYLKIKDFQFWPWRNEATARHRHSPILPHRKNAKANPLQRPHRSMKSDKTKPLYVRNCCISSIWCPVAEACAAPLSSVRHAGRKTQSDRRAGHLLSLSERRDSGEAKSQKQTHREHRHSPILTWHRLQPVFCEGQIGHRLKPVSHRKCKNKPTPQMEV